MIRPDRVDQSILVDIRQDSSLTGPFRNRAGQIYGNPFISQVFFRMPGHREWQALRDLVLANARRPGEDD